MLEWFKKNWSLVASWVVLIVVSTAMLQFRACNPDEPSSPQYIIKERVVIDTFITPPDTIRFAVPPKKLIYRDTVIMVVHEKDTLFIKPFTATLDTSLLCLDSLSIEFSYPHASFLVRAKSKPDTNIAKTVFRDSLVAIKENTLIKDISTHTAAILIGYLLGRVK